MMLNFGERLQVTDRASTILYLPPTVLSSSPSYLSFGLLVDSSTNTSLYLDTLDGRTDQLLWVQVHFTDSTWKQYRIKLPRVNSTGMQLYFRITTENTYHLVAGFHDIQIQDGNMDNGKYKHVHLKTEYLVLHECFQITALTSKWQYERYTVRFRN